MPQVFGTDEIGLISQSSLWLEAASEEEIERATYPSVAEEARARGLVPLRMGIDPIWHHPDTGRIRSLAPAHTGGGKFYRRIQNDLSELKRSYPTEEETARASRTPEQIEADALAAAKETRTKKQQAVETARRKKEQEKAAVFARMHHPFKNIDEVRQAFNRSIPGARMARPGETVDQFAGRLRDLTPSDRQRVHRSVFPERYK